MEVPSFNSFQEILAHYRSFLKGDIPACPTHGAPLEEESQLILPQLLALNDNGILTVDSQPGLLEYEAQGQIYIPDPIEATDIEHRQRAYVDCYMPEELYQRLAQLLAPTDLMIFGQRYTRPSSSAPKVSIPVTITSYHYEGKDHVDIESRMPIMWLAPDLEIILCATPVATQKRILQDLYSVRIVDPNWGETSYLFEEILHNLNQ